MSSSISSIFREMPLKRGEQNTRIKEGLQHRITWMMFGGYSVTEAIIPYESIPTICSTLPIRYVLITVKAWLVQKMNKKRKN